MSKVEEVTVPKVLLERVLGRLDELEDRIGGYREQNERDKAKIRQQITQVEQKAVDDTDEDTAAVQPDEGGTDDTEPTPMERLLRMGAEGVMADVTASVKRAKTIAAHFGQWASKTPKGAVIKDNLKTLLQTATGEQLAWKQVYRACRALEKFTKGAVRFEKHRRHGWMLIAEPPVVRKLGRASSATGG